ncbi:MAG: radical SAM family heme chaperone HemW [Bacteroidetes bacterium]|nr:MAG: radical SAM family heme chaperone HemW [Bacteroidota bacterium]
MSGIYLHIPFCRKACHYCDFHFSTSTKSYADVLASMKAELRYWAPAWEAKVQTIYFGGGTPSMLDEQDLRELLEIIRSEFDVEQGAEITLEANPEDISGERLSAWKEAGVNRLSIGVQSFFDDELEWMNRNHKASKSIESVRLAQKHGIDNITIDLIYGVPASSMERWKENVKMALELEVPHISAYALTVEPKTALAHSVKVGKVTEPSEGEAHAQFVYLRSALNEAGFEAYEISNYGKPGWHSVHNSNYWNGVPYLGIGPGAHSFDGDIRRWNIRNNVKYAHAIQKGVNWFEIEQLSVRDRYNEFVMTGVRRSAGISLEEVRVRFGEEYSAHLQSEAERYIENGWLAWNGDRLCLTSDGLFFADGIAADLFLV